MSSDAPSARELTRRLLARAAPPGAAPDGALPAVQATCEQTYRVLTRSLGMSGSRALLARALAQSRSDNPLLDAISISGRAEGGFDDVAGAVAAHGGPAVAAGLAAVLEASIGLLGRLIGMDMVARLVAQDADLETLDDEDGT